MIARRLIFLSLDGAHQRTIPTWKHGRLTKVFVDSKKPIIGEALLSGEQRGFSLIKFGPDFEGLFTIAVKEREKIPILEEQILKEHRP